MLNYLKIWDNIRASYWFVPIVCITLSFILAIVFLILDKSDHNSSFTELLFFSGTTQEAKTILSNIAGFFVSLIGIVFSLTIIVVTLASNQFGSKLIRNFMHDYITQLVLGLFTGTFIFCITTLYLHAKYTDLTPKFSVSIAYVSSVVNVLFLVHFIHHVSRSIQVSQILKFISSEFLSTIDRIKCYGFSKPVKQSLLENERYLIRSAQTGYIQTININKFVEKIEKANIACVFLKKPGDFVVSDTDDLYQIYSNTEPDKKFLSEMNKLIIIGSERTPVQDPLFSLSQLTIMSIRMLSPSINDPHAVISVINQITSCLSKFLTVRDLFGDYCQNKSYNLHIPCVSFESCLDVTLKAIIFYAIDHPLVMQQVMAVLLRLKQQADEQNRVFIDKLTNEILQMVDESDYHDKPEAVQIKELGTQLLNH